MPRKWVYRIGVIAFCFAIFITPANYLIFGEVKPGKVAEIVVVRTEITGIPVSIYPRIEFEYKNQTYSLHGEENDSFVIGEVVDVIFLKNNPEKSKVYSFVSLFIGVIIELPIGLLIWWALFKSYPRLFQPKKEEWFDNLIQK